MTATVSVYSFGVSGLEHRGTAPAPVLLKPLPLIEIDTTVEDTPNIDDAVSPLEKQLSALLCYWESLFVDERPE